MVVIIAEAAQATLGMRIAFVALMAVVVAAGFLLVPQYKRREQPVTERATDDIASTALRTASAPAIRPLRSPVLSP